MNKATRVVGIILIALAVCYSTFAQRRPVTKLPRELPDKCDHDRDSFYEDLRILEVKVTAYDPKTGVIEYIFEGTRTVSKGTFQLTKVAYVPDEIKPGKSNYVVIYCMNLNHGTGPNNRNKFLIYIERVKDGKGKSGR